MALGGILVHGRSSLIDVMIRIRLKLYDWTERISVMFNHGTTSIGIRVPTN
jgi:hypothetical protein